MSLSPRLARLRHFRPPSANDLLDFCAVFFGIFGDRPARDVAENGRHIGRDRLVDVEDVDDVEAATAIGVPPSPQYEICGPFGLTGVAFIPEEPFERGSGILELMDRGCPKLGLRRSRQRDSLKITVIYALLTARLAASLYTAKLQG